ncbi:MAG: dipeptidase PepE [Flavobacterium sp.]
MRKAIIASTSTLHGGGYLEYLQPTLQEFFKEIKQLLFIPFARPGGITHDAYTEKAAVFFQKMNIQVQGLHAFENPKEAILHAEAIFTGGGNTFVLVDQLHRLQLMPVIKQAVNQGTLYLGSSAGSNITGLTMQTTNDMPIVYPSSFQTIGLVPFNLNPHYLDPDPNSTHMGETRETRIKEFHAFNTQPVVGLREGSWLEVVEDTITLKGNLSARIFTAQQAPYELESNSILAF